MNMAGSNKRPVPIGDNLYYHGVQLNYRARKHGGLVDSETPHPLWIYESEQNLTSVW